MLPAELRPGDLFRRAFGGRERIEELLRPYAEPLKENLRWMDDITGAAQADRDALGDILREKLPVAISAMMDDAFLRPTASMLLANCGGIDLEKLARLEVALSARQRIRDYKGDLWYGRAHTLVKVAFAVDLHAASRALQLYWRCAFEIGSRNPDDTRFIAEVAELEITAQRFRGPMKALARILARCFEGPLSDLSIFLWFLARELGCIRRSATLPRRKGDRYNQCLSLQKLGIASELDTRLARIRNATQHEDGIVVTDDSIQLHGPDHVDWGTIDLCEFLELAFQHIVVGAGVRAALMLAPMKAYDELGLLDDDYREVAEVLRL